LTTVLVGSPLALLLLPNIRSRVRADVSRAITPVNAALFALLFVPLTVVFWRAVFTTPEGLFTGVYVNRNDLPLHIAIVQGFADGGNFPPQHPEFAGARLTYPFLVDFIAAQFALAGLSIEHAFAVQNLLLLAGLIVLLYHWARTLTGSVTAARLTPLLVLAGSGLGWLMMIREYHAGQVDALTFMSHLPRDYTINTNGLRWGNITTTMLVTQRSFLLGLPLFLMVTAWWWRAVSDAPAPSRSHRYMLAAGIAAGLLPLVHAHTFIVVMGVAGALALLFPAWRLWLSFFAIALLIAVPQLAWISRGSMIDSRSFIGWHFGWSKGTESFWWFWFKNTGFFIPLLAAALMMRGRLRLVSPTLLRFYAPFLLCFIVPQLVKLAPRVSGNIKVLIYWYIASVPLVALLLAALWRRGSMARVTATGVVLSLTLATALDAWRILSGASTVRVFDASGVAFADAVRRTTPPGAVILHAPTRNHPVFLTGRLSVLGNISHVTSHGLDHTAREAALRRIYAGDPAATDLLSDIGIDYVVLGPQERRELDVNDRFLEQYPVVASEAGFKLHRIAPERHRQASATREP
jgi:hypothetical protein